MKHLMILLMMLVLSECSQQRAMVLHYTSFKCFTQDPIQLDIQIDLQYAMGLSFQAWIFPKFKLSNNEKILLALFSDSSPFVAGAWISGNQNILLKLQQTQQTFTKTIANQWIFFQLAFIFETNQLKLTYDQQEFTVQSNDNLILPNTLWLQYESISFLTTQSSCFNIQDMTLSAMSYVQNNLQASKSTQVILHIPLSNQQLDNIAGDLLIKGYMGYKKQNNQNGPSYNSNGDLQFKDGESMLLEDYGQINSRLVDKGEFIFSFWIKLSSNSVDQFNVLCIKQGMIEDQIPQFLLGFQTQGLGYLIRIFWNEQMRLMLGNEIKIQQSWEHISLSVIANKIISYMNGNQLDQQTFDDFEWYGYNQIYLGDRLNKLSQYVSDQYFLLKDFRIILGTYFEQNDECQFLLARNYLEEECIECRDAYVLKDGKCVLNSEQCNEWEVQIGDNQLLNYEYSNNNDQSAQYNQEIIKFKQKMKCIPNILFIFQQAIIIQDNDYIILEPFILDQITDSQFLTVPQGQVQQFESKYYYTCDPSFEVGYSTLLLDQVSKKFQITLKKQYQWHYNVQAVIVKYKGMKQIDIKSITWINNQQIEIDLQVDAQGEALIKYVIMNQHSSTLSSQAIKDGLQYQSNNYQPTNILGINKIVNTQNLNNVESIMVYQYANNKQIITNVNEKTYISRTNLQYYFLQIDSSSNSIPLYLLDSSSIIVISQLPGQLQSYCAESMPAPYIPSYQYIKVPDNQQSIQIKSDLNNKYVWYTISSLKATPNKLIDIQLDNTNTFQIQGTSYSNLEIKYIILPCCETGYIHMNKDTFQTPITQKFTNKYENTPKVFYSLVGWDIEGSNSIDSINLSLQSTTKEQFTLKIQTLDQTLVRFIRVAYLVLEYDLHINYGIIQDLTFTNLQTESKKIPISDTLPTNQFFYSLTGISYQSNQDYEFILEDPLGQVQFTVQTQGTIDAVSLLYSDFQIKCDKSKCNKCSYYGNGCTQCKIQGNKLPNCECPDNTSISSCSKCENPRCQRCTESQVCLQCFNDDCDCSQDIIDPISQKCLPIKAFPINPQDDYTVASQKQFLFNVWIYGKVGEAVSGIFTSELKQDSMTLNNVPFFEGIESHINRWIWLSVNVENTQCDAYLTLLDDLVIKYAIPVQEFVANSKITVNLDMCKDAKLFNGKQTFTLPQLLNIQYYDQPQLEVEYSTSGIYKTEQIIGNPKYQTFIGLSSNIEPTYDPIINTELGLYFQDPEAIITIPKFELKSNMAIAFWFYVSDISTKTQASNQFIFKAITQRKSLKDSSRSITQPLFIISIRASNPFIIEICYINQCFSPQYQLQFQSWKYVVVQFTNQLLQLVYADAQFSKQMKWISISGIVSYILGQNQNQNGIYAPFYLQNFQIFKATYIQNPQFGANTPIQFIQSGSLMLLCSKDHVLTQDNECVENKRINCNPGSEFSYYNDPIFRTCMQCVNEDLSHTCNCVEGQYADTDGECVQCEEQCFTCTNTAKQCIECIPNRVDPPFCGCKDGYYLTSDNQCERCNMNICSTCNEDSNNCLTCAPLRSLPNCDCDSGYYEAMETCQECNRLICKTCEKGPNNCLTCAQLRVGPPYCGCQDGYVEIDRLCQICFDKCLTCVKDQNTCVDCVESRINPPSCKCQSGYYETENSECYKCGPQCKECIYNADTCLSCGEYRLNAPICICSKGFYENLMGQCKKCEYQCNSCENSSDNCLICIGKRIDAPKCECPSNSYEEPKTKECVLCAKQFENCENCTSKKCLKCQKDYVLKYSSCDVYIPADKDFSQCSKIYRENTQFCYECDEKYYLNLNRCGQSCYSYQTKERGICSTNQTQRIFDLQDQLDSLSLPRKLNWQNPFFIIVSILKGLSPLLPSLSTLIMNIHLISTPIFMQIYIPSDAYVILQTIYYIQPQSRMFYISLFMFNDYNHKINKEYQYYSNGINSIVIWEIAGEAISIFLLCIIVKYIIFMVYKFVQIRSQKKDQNQNLQQDDEISMDSLEENEAEDLLNQEEDSDDQPLQLEGEIEMQDFSQAYQNIGNNDEETPQVQLLDDERQSAKDINQPVVIQQKRPSTQIKQGTLKQVDKVSCPQRFIKFLLHVRLPKIPWEYQYTIIFACLLEVILIPIAFGALSGIMISNQVFYMIWGFIIYSICCLYVFLIIYLCAYRHYTKSWQYLRLFYTQLTYIEWYRETNNQVYNYSNYKVKLILIYPALSLLRNISLISFFVFLRNIPHLSLSLSIGLQSTYILLGSILRPYFYSWLNFFHIVTELLLLAYLITLLIAHSELFPEMDRGRIIRPFDLLQLGKDVSSIGTFIIVIVILYILSTMFLICLKSLYLFVRATSGLVNKQNKEVDGSNKVDLEFSSKSKTMLLRERLGKQQANQSTETLNGFWKRMSSKPYIQQIHASNIGNQQRMEYRNRNKIKTIGQYNKWIRLHQMELESDNEESYEENKYEEYNNNEDEQQFTSRQKYSLAQEYHSKVNPSDKLELSQFNLIGELLDSNMDNQDIFIGRGELTDFVSEELLKDDVFDLLDSNDEEQDEVRSKSMELIQKTLDYLDCIENDDKDVSVIIKVILNKLRDVILICNDKEYDELLLCGLFSIKYFCKRFTDMYDSSNLQNLPSLLTKMTTISSNLIRQLPCNK